MGRFKSADATINRNLYEYAANNPAVNKDNYGFETVSSIEELDAFMQMYNGGSSYDGPTMKTYLAQLETITSLEKSPICYRRS